jgi:PAS domain S-box-containing protein
VKTATGKYFQNLTQRLRLNGPLAKDPTAQTLYALLLVLAVWFGVWNISLLLIYPHLDRLLVAVLQQVALVAPLALLRYGLLRQASLVYLTCTWLSATVRIAIGTGIHSTTQIIYVTLPILAVWLLGYRAALWTAGACLGSSLIFACLDLAGVHRVDPILAPTPLATWSFLLYVTLSGVVPLAHVMRTLRTTLAESHRNAEELRKTVDQIQVEIVTRERTERALRESEERFRVMADTVPVLTVAADANGNATFFNKAWLDFTGRAMAQELGTGWAASVHPEDLDGCLNGISASYTKRSLCNVQYRLRRADGKYRLLLCNGVPRFEPDGAFVGYVASCTDITDLKRNQEEAMARQKLLSLGVLAGGIAHDFNNLLGSIMASSELLLEELAANPSALESAKRIDAVASRASGVVRQLMVYAGHESAQFEQVDLAAVVREMLQLMQLSISKKAELKVAVPAKLPLINANAAQIRQVIMNLVTNASEALGGKDGVIAITLNEVHHELEFGGRFETQLPPGDYLSLVVSDTGCGMTEEVLAALFDPFFTTKGAGRGLGLSAVQGIIRSHGGVISVTSAPGQGSRFEVLLPSTSQPNIASSAINRPASSKGSDRNESSPRGVLLIEDEDTLRAAVAKMLRRNGFFVLEAAEGGAAVNLFRTHTDQIHAVLLDATLPGMSGRQVLEELRKTRPGAKVILTSAYGRDQALEAVGAEPSQVFVRKPYRLDEIAGMIEEICLQQLSKSAALGL